MQNTAILFWLQTINHVHWWWWFKLQWDNILKYTTLHTKFWSLLQNIRHITVRGKCAYCTCCKAVLPEKRHTAVAGIWPAVWPRVMGPSSPGLSCFLSFHLSLCHTTCHLPPFHLPLSSHSPPFFECTSIPLHPPSYPYMKPGGIQLVIILH